MRAPIISMLVACWAIVAPLCFAASGNCGNEVVEVGEACDDGMDNGTAASCCNATCQFKPDGNASCDGNACTRPDNCTAGVCSPGNCADGSSCTICGGECVDGGTSCDCDFAPPTCPASGVMVGGACWYFGSPATSCTQVCGNLGLSYNDATRTFAGSEGSFANCTLVKDAIDDAGQGSCDPLPVGDLNCNVLGGAPAIGCHCAPEFGFLVALVRCTAPTTTAGAAAADRARYCACH